jgi:hypothetical protein
MKAGWRAFGALALEDRSTRTVRASPPYLISKKPQPTEEQAHVVSHPTASM